MLCTYTSFVQGIWLHERAHTRSERYFGSHRGWIFIFVAIHIWVVLLIGWSKFSNSQKYCPTSEKWRFINMEFLRSFLRRHFTGKPVLASRSVGCFLKLRWVIYAWKCHTWGAYPDRKALCTRDWNSSTDAKVRWLFPSLISSVRGKRGKKKHPLKFHYPKNWVEHWLTGSGAAARNLT